jgi:hypothetical protein
VNTPLNNTLLNLLTAVVLKFFLLAYLTKVVIKVTGCAASCAGATVKWKEDDKKLSRSILTP